MPRGASPKRERQYQHIKQSAKKSGRYGGRAEEVAARTVNKIRRKKGETKSQQSRARKSTSRSRPAKARVSTARKKARRSSAPRSRSSSNGRGFAGMSAARQRSIAAEGGRAAHQRGTA